MNEKEMLLIFVVFVVLLYLFKPNWICDDFKNLIFSKSPNQVEKFNNNTLSQKVLLSTGVNAYSPMNSITPPWTNSTNVNGMNPMSDDLGLNFNMCSKSCCSQQYPTPFGLPSDPALCSLKDELVPSSYSCNNGWQDSGCLCMTKKQAKFLGTRGNNITSA